MRVLVIYFNGPYHSLPGDLPRPRSGALWCTYIINAVTLHAATARKHLAHRQGVASRALKENEIATGLCTKPLSEAMGIPGPECGRSAMPESLPFRGKCVCVAYTPAFEMMRQALRRDDLRAAEVSSNYGTAIGCAPPETRCTAQLVIDGSTHRGGENCDIGRAGR